MSDFFIVSKIKFFRYPTLAHAEGARNRMANAQPENKYRVYRCKSHLHCAKNFATMTKLLRDIRDQGLHEGTYDRLNDLLAKIDERDSQAQASEIVAAIEHKAETS